MALQRLQFSRGRNGTAQTLEKMREIVHRARFSRVIRDKAMALTQGLKQKDYLGEAARLFLFVRDEVRYSRDPVGVEWLQHPELTLSQQAGDCDDKTTLLAALLRAVGHPVKLVAIGFRPGQFAHVYPEVLIKGHWIPLEPTEHWPMGKAVNPALVKDRLERLVK